MSISNNDIKAGLLEYLKTLTSVSDLVTTLEMKENQYQGRDFTYPGIRIELKGLIPNFEDCGYHLSTFSFKIFSEQASSQEADNIAGVVYNNVVTSFNANSLRFWAVRSTSLSPALRIDRLTWQSEVVYQSRISLV